MRDHVGMGALALPHRLCILLSYWYYKDIDLDALFAKYFTPPYPDVFLDSGAFSAVSHGATIDLDAYCAFLHRFAHRITTYANLDVIGDAAATARNQQRMERAGLAPLPVYHVGEPVAALRRYLDAGYPYIALGGMVPYMRDARAKLMPWLVRCFRLAQPTGAVYHGFGCTTWSVVKALPWYSVDSSSWGAGFRFGTVPVFDARAGIFRIVKLGDHATCYRYAAQLRALGFDPADFAERARNQRATLCALSALSYLHAEAWLRRRHGTVVLRTPTSTSTAAPPTGLRTYLAQGRAAVRDVTAAARGLCRYLAAHDGDRDGVGDTPPPPAPYATL